MIITFNDKPYKKNSSQIAHDVGYFEEFSSYISRLLHLEFGSSLWCLLISLSLSHWYPGSDVVLDFIDS